MKAQPETDDKQFWGIPASLGPNSNGENAGADQKPLRRRFCVPQPSVRTVALMTGALVPTAVIA